MYHPPYSPLTCLLGEVLHLEEVEPQLLVGPHPQVPLADGHENGGLQDRVGGKVMQLHPIIMQDGPHELAWWHPEPPLMEGDKAHHVAL
jgi:hypothetical protein